MLGARLGALVILLAATQWNIAALAPGVTVEDISVITADGSSVTGKLAYPTGGSPTQLVVMVHGYGNTVEGAWVGHITETAGHGAAVVSVNFRDNLGFPAMRGAQDTNAAALAALARFPTSETVYLFGVSMGGAISGIAAAEKPLRPDGAPLYDHWIDVEGVANIIETYLEARAVGHPAQDGIERDAGGTLEEVPLEYARRTVVARVPDLLYLKTVTLVHSLDDGTVPYDQTRELALLVRAGGLPTEVYTVLRERPDHTEGTTGTAVIFGAAGQPDPSETTGLHLSGHAWEGDRGSLVMSTGLERLFELLDGGAGTSAYAEYVVDGSTGDGEPVGGGY